MTDHNPCPGVELFKNEGVQTMTTVLTGLLIAGVTVVVCGKGCNDRWTAESEYQNRTIQALYAEPGLTPDDKLEAAAVVKGYSPYVARLGRRDGAAAAPQPPAPIRVTVQQR